MTARQKALLAVVSIFVVALAGAVSFTITSKRAAIKAAVETRTVQVHPGYNTRAYFTYPTSASSGQPITLSGPHLRSTSRIDGEDRPIALQVILTDPDFVRPTFYYSIFSYTIFPNDADHASGEFSYTSSSGQERIDIYVDLGFLDCASYPLGLLNRTITTDEYQSLRETNACVYRRMSGAPEEVMVATIPVTTAPPTGQLTLSPASLNIRVNETADVTAQKSTGTLGSFEVICDAPSIAKLKSGDAWVPNILVSSGNQFTVKGMRTGNTTCRVTERDTGQGVSLPVAVTTTGLAIVAMPNSLTLGVGKTGKVTVYVFGTNFFETWCDDTNIAQTAQSVYTFDLTIGTAEDTITAKAIGSTTCHYQAGGMTADERANVSVTVTEAPSPGPDDTDGDGVPDETDNCPTVANPEQTNTDGDAQGDACDPDDDNDGIADGDDRCPLQAGTAANNGCPEGADSDGDGVLDSDDECPDVPGTAANNGCPEGEPWPPPDEPPGPPVVGFDMAIVPNAWNLITFPFTPKSDIQDLTGILGRTPSLWGWYGAPNYLRAGGTPPATPKRGVGFWIKVADTPANPDDDKVINGIKHRVGIVSRTRYESDDTAPKPVSEWEVTLPDSTSGINIAGNPFEVVLPWSKVMLKFGDTYKELKKALEDGDVLALFTWSPTEYRYIEITAATIDTAPTLKPYQGFWIITYQGKTVTLKFTP